MRPLATVERFLERVLERPSARLFRTRIRPIQVLRRVERAIEAERVVRAGQATIPDQIAVGLNPRDLAALGRSDELATYLADGALAFARAHGYRLAERPSVRIHADAGSAPGDPTIVATHGDHQPSSAPAHGGPDGWAVDAGTRAFQAPVARAPSAVLEVRPLGGGSQRIRVAAEPLTIGRSSDNVVVLDDPAVSRHHARIQPRGGALVLTDLGSTNGTRVNGSTVREVVLGEGDDIAIGDTVISVHADDPTGVGIAS